jgi:hypothetical protein
MAKTTSIAVAAAALLLTPIHPSVPGGRAPQSIARANPEAESGHEDWDCAIITHSGSFKLRIKIRVDLATGDYSILGCRGVPVRTQLPPSPVCSELIQ